MTENNKTNIDERQEESVENQINEESVRADNESSEIKADEAPLEEKTETVEDSVKAENETGEEGNVTETIADTEAKNSGETVTEKPIADKKSADTKPRGDSQTADVSFDWNAYGDSKDIYSSGEREEFEKMYDDTLSTIAENEVVEEP